MLNDPADAAEDVERQEAAVVHLADAGDDGRERAHERHEARDDDRLAAVALVELLRAQEVLAREEQRLLALEERRAPTWRRSSSRRCRRRWRRHRQQQVRAAGSSSGRLAGLDARAVDARRHEQRVARQEEADEQPRLGEDDEDERREAAPGDESPGRRKSCERGARRSCMARTLSAKRRRMSSRCARRLRGRRASRGRRARRRRARGARSRDRRRRRRRRSGPWRR